jgi:hypothetical protein
MSLLLGPHGPRPLRIEAEVQFSFELASDVHSALLTQFRQVELARSQVMEIRAQVWESIAQSGLPGLDDTRLS